jgi:hypothetical protein
LVVSETSYRFPPGPNRHLINVFLGFFVAAAVGVLVSGGWPVAAILMAMVIVMAWVANRAPLLVTDGQLIIRDSFRAVSVPVDQLVSIDVVRTEHLLPWYAIQLSFRNGDEVRVDRLAGLRSSRFLMATQERLRSLQRGGGGATSEQARRPQRR